MAKRSCHQCNTDRMSCYAACTGETMWLFSDLAFFALSAGGVGWMAAHDSYWGMIVFAACGLAALVEFNRVYQKDLPAARKWREMRWNALKALEKQYRDEPPADPHKNPEELVAHWNAAERRAAKDTTDRYGPVV